MLAAGPLAFSQVIVNHYLKVDSVLTDRVRVENTAELASFQPGDKVLLIQMTGATLTGTQTSQGFFGQAYNCGKFEILQIDEVLGTTVKYITFTDDLDNAYDHGEKIQLVRILEGDKITVNGTVTAKNWDGNSGGIVAIIGLDTIDLQGTIDVAGKGFRGGQPDESDYLLDDCHSGDVIINLPATTYGYAGYKGEGIVTASYPYAKGAAHALNGGGGGQGLFAGGGGGSNYRDAGNGGQQAHSCGDDINKDAAASGGYNLSSNNRFYLTTTRQIIMGGGGGSGTENKSNSLYATPGGNGGGIVMLITETLLGNGGLIKANGQDVTVSASASGGGGGGGGTILLDAAAYSGPFSLEIRGGKGGNTVNCTGAGGGGSGGILWHSGSYFPSVSVTIDSAMGEEGNAIASCGKQYGEDGHWDGMKKTSLILPLNGFLFNTVHGKDTICAGQAPNPITGSNPKGGNGIYSFAWYKSTDSIAWDSIASARDIIPGPLSQTTWYRRIVRSEGIIDVSRPVKIFVYTAISGNTISANDTLCYNNPAKQLSGASLAGGNGTYSYRWQSSSNSITWNDISGATAASYNPGPLAATRYYRRIATSAEVCRDTSQQVTLTVLQDITSNQFHTEDTTLCRGFGPGPLNATTPLNGDGTYRYLWQQKTVPGNWTDIASSNIKQYDPGVLSDTMHYRRIVFSGNDNACADTSAEKKVIVLPSISNNLISIDSSHWCAGNTPHEITGQQPAGGQPNEYLYKWQIRTSGDWGTIAGATGINLTPSMVEENTSYRRLVASGTLTGGQYACRDTSPPLLLTIVPYINNNLDLPGQTLCQHSLPLPFNPPAAVTGGNDVFAYQWLAREEGTTGWNPAPGLSSAASYAPDTLERTTHFARRVSSDICSDTSGIVTVTVYPKITGNLITGSPVLYTCYNTAESIKASLPLNGSGTYACQWQQWNGTAWEDAPGNTANTLTGYDTPALTDTMLYRRIVFSSPDLRECKDTSQPVLVRINPLPSGDVAASVDTICGNASAFVSFSVSGGNGPWKVTVGADGIPSSSKPGITAMNDSLPLPFNNNQAGYRVKMLEIEDDSTCKADPAGFNHESVVMVYAVPAADADADKSDENRVCGNQFQLKASPTDASHTGKWTFNGGSFTDPADAETMITVDEDHYGERYIRWTVTNWHCPDVDSVQVTFDRQPVAIDAGEPQELEYLYATQLTADPPEVGTGTWKVVKGSGTISDENDPHATIIELASSNLLRWTIVNGICPAIKDSVEITVKGLTVQKGFTPNDDGINDLFVIPAPNAEKIEIRIFNRAGVEVFYSPDYTRGELWGGLGKNKNPLPEGTYFYWMKIWVRGKSEPEERKDFIEVLR